MEFIVHRFAPCRKAQESAMKGCGLCVQLAPKVGQFTLSALEQSTGFLVGRVVVVHERRQLRKLILK
jgi:hypothetical protein